MMLPESITELFITIEPTSFAPAVFDFRQVDLPRYDLQLFAAEDEGRTEDPTERRKREEREKGNVPRSQEIASASVLIGTVVVLFFTAAYMFHQTMTVFQKYLGGGVILTDLHTEDALRMLFDLFWDCAKILGPIMIASVVMAVVGNVSQVGFLFTTDPLQFRPEKLIPDFKRVLPTRRTLYTLLKTIVQVGIIASAAYFIIVNDFIPMLRTSDMDLAQAVGLFGWVSFKLLLIIAVISLLLAVPDYFYQRFEFMENLKMTVSELKRERKEEEGDPMIRQRQRDRAYDLRRQRNMLKEVPKADVVVTNPTHYSVALRYNPAENPAPVVLAKGADQIALQIRTIARQNNIPIEESPELARSLYRDVEIGQAIPENMYRVVSLLFARIAKFRARTPVGVS